MKKLESLKEKLIVANTIRETIMDEIKELKIKEWGRIFKIKEGGFVLVYGKQVAVVEQILIRDSSPLDRKPWIKVRVKNENGDFSNRITNAFDNWETLVRTEIEELKELIGEREAV
jgi:hypothetical protein